jgi:hypothetical protein
MVLPAEPTFEDTRRSPTRIISRFLIVGLVLALAAMWAYAFFGDIPVPGRLDDRTFPAAAEPICARGRAGLDTLPRAFEATDASARADVVDRATTMLEAMVADLRPVVPAGADHDRLDQWLDDWDTYNRDRRDYSARLRQDPTARFWLTQSDRDKRQINEALDNFAKVNAMASCATPEDVV